MKNLNKYFYSMKLGIQNSMEYRVDFFLDIINGFFPIFVQFFVWSAIFKNSSSSVIQGYTFSGMMVYLVYASVISKFIAAGFEYEIGSDIKNGGLSKFIIKPMSYFIYRISCFVGMKSIQLVISFLTLIVTGLILRFCLGINMEYERIFVFLVVLLLSTTLNFLLFYAISTISFWTSEIWGIIIFARLSISIISGGILPLDFLGEKVSWFLNVLPFKYMIYFPVSIISGRTSSNDVLSGILIELIWILFFIFLVNRLWRAGIKNYIAAGG